MPITKKKQHLRLLDIIERERRGAMLSVGERRLFDAWKRGHELNLQRIRTRIAARATIIAEQQILAGKTVKEIAAMENVPVESVRRFIAAHRDLMSEEYHRIATYIEQVKQASLISAGNLLAQETQNAVRVFQDHLQGEKRGELDPRVRQRAAEKVLELTDPKGAGARHVVHSFDARAQDMISNRLHERKLERGKELVVEAEKVED